MARGRGQPESPPIFLGCHAGDGCPSGLWEERRMGSETHTCVAALGLGEEGVNGTHGGSKDVGRREAKGRASQRKHLRERRYSPVWWLFWDLGHNCVCVCRGGGDQVCWGGEDQREGDIQVATKPNLSISPVESWCPRQPGPHLPRDGGAQG